MATGDIIVGIDLGTTNSLVAVYEDAGPRTIPDERGDPLLPSVVRFEPDGQGGLRAVVGREAAERSVEFPRTTVSSVKRLMGRSLADAAGDVPYLSYEVVEGEHNTARIAIPLDSDGATERRSDGGAQQPGAVRVVSAQEVSAIILRELAARAGRELGVPVRRAVVTVPAYFDDAQRQATRDAGRLAGLEVVRIVNEPTAAALAYGLGLGEQRRALTVAVFDLGGGTFDVSVLRITPNSAGASVGELPAFFQVLSTAGDTHLGGDDVDHALVRRLAAEMREQLKIGVAEDPLAGLGPATRRALKQFAQSIKHRLSEEERASVEIAVEGGGTFSTTVTRAQLEEMMAPWVERAIACCARAVGDAGLGDKDEGGRMKDGGGRGKEEGEAPSRGLGDSATLSQVGRGIDAVIMVGGATRTPLVRRRVREFFGVEPYTALDPDRVVALGAAVQAAIMSGRARSALLLDVVPLSLGIETAGGAVAKLIMRNSTVPARATEMFTTSVDGQRSIKIHVLQGEREMVEHCRSLGVFDLRGLPPMPAGVPQLEVEFLVDAGGVLRVTATERRTGKRAELQVVPNHGLTRGEVERMEAESFAHAREDMARHRVVDLVVNGKLDLKWIGEQLAKHGAALDPGYKSELEGRIEALADMVSRAEKDWKSADPNNLHRAKEELDRASVRLQEIAITASLRQP